MLRQTRRSAAKICFCKKGKDDGDEIINCLTSNKANCPGNGFFHKSCIKESYTTGDYTCDLCKENEQDLERLKVKKTPKRIQPDPKPSTSFVSEEEEFIDDEFAGVDEQPIGDIELESLHSYKKRVEKVISHHYINRSYKNGERLQKKLHFKVKWSGFNITQHETSDILLHPGVEANGALREYCKGLPQRTARTLLARHPEYAKFLTE